CSSPRSSADQPAAPGNHGVATAKPNSPRACPAAGRASAPGGASWLAGVELDKQRVGFGQHGLPVKQASPDEHLASVDVVDAGVDVKFRLDGHDFSVVDMQERGALVAAAGESERGVAEHRVKELRDAPAVH